MSLPTEDGVFLWQTNAKCGDKDVPTSIFFDNEKEAKKICLGCPVIDECLFDALVYNYSGVWGGLSEKERHSRKLKTEAEFLRDDLKESGLYNKKLKV